jgi:uncharacterized protein YjbI with pentapeptide repeats
MTDSLNVKDKRIQKSSFENVDLSGSIFRGVNLSRCVFDDVNFGQCRINNVSLGESKITNSCFTHLEIDGNISEMRINGVLVSDLFKAYNLKHK